MKRIKLIICILIVCILSTNAQTFHSIGITPMHKFFQQYADSTIIVEYQSYDSASAKYRILSKKDSFINAFIYEAIDTTWKNLKEIKSHTSIEFWHQLSAKKVLYQNNPADINMFFNISSMNKSKANQVWKSAQQLILWSLVDDSIYGNGCRDKSFPGAIDGLPDIIHLITKNEIKTLIYEYPDVYEKLCPGNTNRKRMLLLNNLFEKNYEEFKSKFK